MFPFRVIDDLSAEHALVTAFASSFGRMTAIFPMVLIALLSEIQRLASSAKRSSISMWLLKQYFQFGLAIKRLIFSLTHHANVSRGLYLS